MLRGFGRGEHLRVTCPVPSSLSDAVTQLPLHLFFLFISSVKQTFNLSILKDVLVFNKHRAEPGNVGISSAKG